MLASLFGAHRVSSMISFGTASTGLPCVPKRGSPISPDAPTLSDAPRCQIDKPRAALWWPRQLTVANRQVTLLRTRNPPRSKELVFCRPPQFLMFYLSPSPQHNPVLPDPLRRAQLSRYIDGLFELGGDLLFEIAVLGITAQHEVIKADIRA